jgi:hypothetical protein
MGYDNGYNQQFNGGYVDRFNRGSYSGSFRGNRGGYNGGNHQSNNRVVKKHSGCRQGIDKKSNPYLIGWNASRRRGMISFIAAPFSGTKEVKSKSGKTWQNWFVKITFKDSGEVKNFSGLYNVSNHKLYIKELNLVANPSAPGGGYFGKHISKVYNR